MATRIFKSMISLIMVAFASIVADAQQVNTTINSHDLNACAQYLAQNLTDTVKNITVVNGDTITRRVFAEGRTLKIKNDTVRYKKESVVSESVLKADTLSVKSRVQKKVRDGQDQDVKGVFNKELKAYRDSINGDNSDVDAGYIPTKVANKYGASVEAHVGYSYAEGVHGPVGGVAVSYERKWWGAMLLGEVGNSKYSSNAINAGDSYLTYRTEGLLMFRPFQLDWLDQNRLFFFGGAGFEYYRTDSKPVLVGDSEVDYLASGGNYLYGTAGVAYEYRFFGTGNTLGVRAQWRNTRATVQNSSDENFGSLAMSLYFKFGIHRNKMSTK